MSFYVFQFLLIACVITLSVRYYHRNGGNGGTVKHVKFANRKHWDENGKHEKDGAINFGNEYNIKEINDRHFRDDGLRIKKSNGLLGDRQVKNSGLREWQNGNIGLRINDWHVGNELLEERQVGDRGFENWQNIIRALW